MPAAPLRAPRALCAGAVAGAGAAVAHVGAGASLPPVWLLLTVVALGTLVSAPLTRRRLDLAGLAGVALVAQAVFHGGFMLHAPGETHALGAMALSHALAAAATVAAALGAERAWWRLLDAALTRLLPRTSHPTAPPTPGRLPSPAAPDGPVLRAVAAPRRTRGPPALRASVLPA